MSDTMLHVRPELSLLPILLYSFFAFGLGLALTPWFISFLRKNKLGKQLRVQAVDGSEATIFRQYHEKKFGTPTMGGLLIWGSIVLTVLFSRFLSYAGAVESSLLQRGEVYVPLFVMVALGILGAIDDYINIVGTNEERLKSFMPKARKFLLAAVIVLTPVLLYVIFGRGHVDQLSSSVQGSFGFLTLPLLAAGLLLVLFVLGFGGAVIDDAVGRVLVRQGKKRGLGVLPKILSLLAISLGAALWFYFKLDYNTVFVPFIGPVNIGLWYLPMAVFIIVGTANAVNVTDGLDGLAGGLLVIAFGSFSILAYVSGLTVLAALCAVTAGAIAAFLWHNVPPALFYMGDTGALALGGTLGVIALMTDHVLVLPLIGAVFVIEMLSVIIQLTSKRLRGGKKVFRAAPIHHHFEALEWGESKVTMRLWIIGAFCAILGIIVGLYGIYLPKSDMPVPVPITLMETASCVS